MAELSNDGDPARAIDNEQRAATLVAKDSDGRETHYDSQAADDDRVASGDDANESVSHGCTCDGMDEQQQQQCEAEIWTASDVDDTDEEHTPQLLEHDDSSVLPEWIRRNFPLVTHEDALKAACGVHDAHHDCVVESHLAASEDEDEDGNDYQVQQQQSPRRAPVCEECGTRQTAFTCADCAQQLCFVCTDAIHIVRELLHTRSSC